MTRLILSTLLIITLPCVSFASSYNVSDYGAKGDGVTDDAAAIQRCIDACSAEGGGDVIFGRGKVFLSGPVEIKPYVYIVLEQQAVWRANPDESIYRLSAFGKNEGEGMMWIYARHARGIGFSGRGTIDGNGINFMAGELSDSYELKPVTTFDPRPHVLTLIDCDDMIIRDITIRDGAYWTVHLIGCDNVVIDGISLLNNLKIRNGDGIDIDHSRKVRVANCHITSGDDCICLKNRREFAEYGPTKDITVTNCVMTSRSCAIKIGSENVDSIARVTFSNCIITDSNRGLGIQNRDEGTVTDVVFSDIILDCRLWSDVWWGKAEPIYVTSYPRANGNHKDANWRFPEGQTEGRCGMVSRIFFNNITATSENGCFVGGETEDKVSDIFFSNVNISLKKRTSYPAGVYDKRPCKGEGFVRREPSAIYVENATNVDTKGIHLR
ncbi:MAG: glycoside hydrolase family 28 protein [Prevotella sp.]